MHHPDWKATSKEETRTAGKPRRWLTEKLKCFSKYWINNLSGGKGAGTTAKCLGAVREDCSIFQSLGLFSVGKTFLGIERTAEFSVGASSRTIGSGLNPTRSDRKINYPYAEKNLRLQLISSVTPDTRPPQHPYLQVQSLSGNSASSNGVFDSANKLRHYDIQSVYTDSIKISIL